MPGADVVQCQKHGKHLGQRGRGDVLIGVLFEEDCVVVQVVQNGRTDAHKTVGRHGRSRDCPVRPDLGSRKSEKEQEKQQMGRGPERQGTGNA